MQQLGRLLWLIITILLVIVAIAFATSNEALINLYLWPFDRALTAPIWLVVMSSFIIGGLFSSALLWAQWVTIRTKLWRLQGKLNKLIAEKSQQQNSVGPLDDIRTKQLETYNQADDNGLEDQSVNSTMSGPLKTNRILRRLL